MKFFERFVQKGHVTRSLYTLRAVAPHSSNPFSYINLGTYARARSRIILTRNFPYSIRASVCTLVFASYTSYANDIVYICTSFVFIYEREHSRDSTYASYNIYHRRSRCIMISKPQKCHIYIYTLCTRKNDRNYYTSRISSNYVDI